MEKYKDRHLTKLFMYIRCFNRSLTQEKTFKPFVSGAASPQNGGGLQHFRHEGGHPLDLAVPGAHPGQDAVHHVQLGALARHEAADLRHQHNHADLPDERRLAPHVGT